MKRLVCIANFGDCGNEPEALRQTLEALNYGVWMHLIGRPQDFMDLLSGEICKDAAFFVFSCHGENGKVIMPRLGEEIYTEKEPRGDFGDAEIRRYLQLSDRCVLNLGCDTGNFALAQVFCAKKNRYIAPKDYVDGNAALLFALRFFYERSKPKATDEKAYQLAAGMDAETKLFRLFE